MVNDKKNIVLYHPEAKVFLEYDLPRLQAIIDTLRLETDSFTASLLREYEDILIEAYRLDKDRLRREGIEKQRLIEEQQEYKSE